MSRGRERVEEFEKEESRRGRERRRKGKQEKEKGQKHRDSVQESDARLFRLKLPNR